MLSRLTYRYLYLSQVVTASQILYSSLCLLGMFGAFWFTDKRPQNPPSPPAFSAAPPFPHFTRLPSASPLSLPHCLLGCSHPRLWLPLTGACSRPVASLSLALSPEFWLCWAPACRRVLEFSSFFLKRAHLISPILVDDMCLRIPSVWLCLPSSLCSLYSLGHQVSPL